MKRLILLIAPVMLVMIRASSSASAVSDTNPSLADSSVSDNETTGSQSEATNSTASATITITMYTGDEGGKPW